MNDKELADRIVELGVGLEHSMFTADYTYYGIAITADKAVRDWRVCGALMERMTPDLWRKALASRIKPHNNGFLTELFSMIDGLLRDPRAICEVCVEALEAGK